MVSFTVELAGIVFGVQALFASTRDFCADYLVDAAPAEFVVLSEADLDAERVHAARQDAREGRAPRTWPPEYLETLALYRKVATLLMPYDTFVFHGATVAVGGDAYVFTAPSGTGKTTHVGYWLSQVPGAYVLNGDKPLLRAFPGEVRAYGTPWQGKECLGTRGNLPLSGLCLLERGSHDEICRIDGHEALPALIRQTYQPDDPMALVHVVDFVGKLCQHVPLWRLHATLDETSALVSYHAMSQGGTAAHG